MGIKATPAEIDAFLAQQDAGPGTSIARTVCDRCTLVLPWPPSVNHYWSQKIIVPDPRSGKKPFVNVYIAEGGKAFRKNAEAAIVTQGNPKIAGRLAVRIAVHAPTKRARDLDNLGKAALDALKNAGVIEDDANIDLLTFRRRAVKPGGELVVRIRKYGENYGELFGA